MRNKVTPAADADVNAGTDAGAGGSYLLDDTTGVRTLVDRTEEPRLRSREQDASADAAPAAPINLAEE